MIILELPILGLRARKAITEQLQCRNRGRYGPLLEPLLPRGSRAGH